MGDSHRYDAEKMLNAIGASDGKESADILPLVYDELRKLAASQLSREPAGQTLQPTALVHEAYLRLIENPDVKWHGKGHFFGAAALAMRRILVDRARRYKAVKHGGGKRGADLHDNISAAGEDVAEAAATAFDLLALDEALDRLASVDKRQTEIVMLRYFAGLSIEETARVMNLSPATVKADWAFARAWLKREVEGQGGGDATGARDTETEIKPKTPGRSRGAKS